MVTTSWMPCLHRMMKVHWTQYEFLFPKLNNCWSITRSHHKHGTLSFGTSLFWPTPADRISVQTRHFVVWHFLILTYSCRSHFCANMALCRLALPYSDLLLPIASLCKHGTLSFGTSLFWPTPANRISVQTRHFVIWHFLILTYSCRSHLCANTALRHLALPYSDLLLPIASLCKHGTSLFGTSLFWPTPSLVGQHHWQLGCSSVLMKLILFDGKE